MNFVHLSDTHILLEKPQENPHFNAALLVDAGGAKLRAAIQKARNYPQKPDVFFFTGDLVHEGKAQDYRFLKNLLDEACGDIPYYVALGNHDRRQAFWAGFYEEAGKSDPYVNVAMLDGLRIISLDTSPVDGTAAGELPQDQLSNLKNELKTPAPKGTVVLLHHPPLGNVLAEFDELCPRRDAFHTIVKNSDVKLVLSGHTHFLTVNTQDGIVYATAASTAFSMDNSKTDGIRFIDACAYNLGRITKDGVYVGEETVGYAYQDLYTMSSEAMAQLIKQEG